MSDNKCTKCGGNGTVTVTWTDSNTGQMRWRTQTCGGCSGSGKA